MHLDPVPVEPDIFPHLPRMAQQFLEQLITHRRLSILTQRRYAHALGLFHDISADINQVSVAALQRCINQLYAKGLVARSLAVMLSAWRTYCTWAFKQGLLLSNPCNHLNAPKPSTPIPKPLPIVSISPYLIAPAPAPEPNPTLNLILTSANQSSKSNKERILAALVVRDQAVLELLYGCGLRTAELLAVDCEKTTQNLSGLDFAAQQVHVLGHGHKLRTVPLPNLVQAALIQWLAVRPIFILQGETKALFLGVRGDRMSATELRRITQRRAAKADFGQGVHPHLLRHSYASHLLHSSGDLRGIQDLLGHASIVSTQAYMELNFQQLATVYENAHPRAKRTIKN
jgi:integrase/recombinase XerC